MNLFKIKKNNITQEENNYDEYLKKMADILAVDESFVKEKYRRIRAYNWATENKYRKLCDLIKKSISNEEFKEKLLGRMNFVKERGVFAFLENGIKGNVDNYLFEALFFANEIVFTSKIGDKVDQGRMICKQNKTCICYSTTVEQIEPIKYFACFALDFEEEHKFQLLDKLKVERISLYNSQNVEILSFSKERKKNYYYNPISFFKILREPFESENFTNRTYIFRDKGYILKHVSCIYDLPNAPKGKYIPMANLENKEQYFITRDERPFSFNIPYDLDYLSVSKEAFEFYKNNNLEPESLYKDSKTFVKKKGQDYVR